MRAGRAITIGVGVFAAILGLCFGLVFLVGAVSRYQSRADAANRVKVTATQIRNAAQQVRVEKLQAQIRFVKSVGVRHAQDEIAKTLTPLYVQFEMVEALKEIAQSGTNNTVVYIPAGANGIPLVSTAAGAVTTPDKG